MYERDPYTLLYIAGGGASGASDKKKRQCVVLALLAGGGSPERFFAQGFGNIALRKCHPLFWGKEAAFAFAHVLWDK